MVTSTSAKPPAPSVTITVKIHVPGAVGVPLSSPFPLSDKPNVRSPPLGGGSTEKVYGAIPPMAVKWYENGTVTVAVMGEGGGLKVSESATAAGWTMKAAPVPRQIATTKRQNLPMPLPSCARSALVFRQRTGIEERDARGTLYTCGSSVRAVFDHSPIVAYHSV